MPIAIKTSYIYSSPNYANKYFLNLVLSGYDYFGLSQFLLVCLFLSLIWLFKPIRKQFSWTKIICLFAVGYFLLILLGLKVDLPKSIAQFQFTRAVSLVGLAIIFSFTRVMVSAEKIQSRAIKGLLLCVVVLVVIEGIWYSSKYSPAPAPDFSEPVTAYTNTYGKKDIENSKVWTSSIGLTGYYAPAHVQLPYSYMGQSDPNQISPRISPLILYQPYMDTIPLANITRLNDYFKIAGTQYIFFDENSPFTKTLLSSDTTIYRDLGVIKDKSSAYHAFETPWQSRNAVAIADKYTNALAVFPMKLKLDQVQDQIMLDEYVKKFVTTIYQPENMSLQITYPTSDSLAVAIPDKLNAHTIYINESFDKNWKGFINNKPVNILPSGPNFMQVILPPSFSEGTLFLKHSWPLSFYISVFLICLIPLELGFIYVAKRVIKK